MWNIEKWKIFAWYPNKMRLYPQRNPKCDDWRWTNFQMQVMKKYTPPCASTNLKGHSQVWSNFWQKMMKNVFCFTLKAFSFSRYLDFCLELFVTYKNGLIKKIGYFQNLWRHNLGNNCNTHISHISRIKRNQTMKFGQLIEYNIKNIFLKNHTQNQKHSRTFF